MMRPPRNRAGADEGSATVSSGPPAFEKRDAFEPPDLGPFGAAGVASRVMVCLLIVLRVTLLVRFRFGPLVCLVGACPQRNSVAKLPSQLAMLRIVVLHAVYLLRTMFLLWRSMARSASATTIMLAMLRIAVVQAVY